MEYLLVTFEDIGKEGVRITGMELTTLTREDYTYRLLRSYYEHQLFGVRKLPLDDVTKSLLDTIAMYPEPRSYYYSDEDSLDYEKFEDYLDCYAFRYVSEKEAALLSRFFKKYGTIPIAFVWGNIMI